MQSVQSMEPDKNKVFRLQGKLRYYDWGGTSFLSELLQIPNPEKKPFAEYWMGAHETASSQIIVSSGDPVPLNEYTRAFAKSTLGDEVARQFGQLPYLLKILDVRQMLSIQVHPSKKNAEIEFSEENERGIALTSAERNYKDRNHKPELMLALSEFWLLHGFKPAVQLLRVFEGNPELYFLSGVFEKQGYEGLYRTVMQMEQSQINRILDPLINRLLPADDNHLISKEQEGFWVARAAREFTKDGNIDRGIFSIYFFNLLNLHPGNAIFQDAGLPHAYLEGQNIEIMANSDNVLRGGLSSKHIDVNELMKHIQFKETIPSVLQGMKTQDHFQVFPTPAPDFELSRVLLSEGQNVRLKSVSAEIYFIMEGHIVFKENLQNQFSRRRGEAFISFDQAAFALEAKEDSILFKAAVPWANQARGI